MKLTEQEISAVCRLLREPDFEVLLNAMANHAEQLNKKLVMQSLDTGDLHNLQGQTRNMVTLIETIHSAPTKKAELSQPKL